MPDAREERPVGFHHESGHDRICIDLSQVHSPPLVRGFLMLVFIVLNLPWRKKYILLDRFDSLNRMIASLCSNWFFPQKMCFPAREVAHCRSHW